MAQLIAGIYIYVDIKDLLQRYWYSSFKLLTVQIHSQPNCKESLNAQGTECNSFHASHVADLIDGTINDIE